MKKILSKNIIIVGLTFLIPGIIAFITKDSFSIYKTLVRPKFAPPSYLFPVAWSILYILMSIAIILVKEDDDDNLKLYYLQLVLNAIWTPIFFLFKNYLFALIDLSVLLITVMLITIKFYKYDKNTLYLLLPYILWLIYAFYLNFYILIYN